MSPGWMTPRPKPAVKINDLPDELLLEIFSYLPLDDMVRSVLVCERWRDLLKGEKELWRRKKWTSTSVGVTRRFLSFGAGIPRLRSLRLMFDCEFGIRFAWPDVTIHLYLGTPLRWEPYFPSFDTESLVVSSLVVEHISTFIECVDTRSLRRICVAEQDLVLPRPREGPYFMFVPTSPHYSCPVRRRTCPEMTHSTQCFVHDAPISGDESASREADASESEGAAAPEAGAFGLATCPALEVVNVHCRRLSDSRIADLCSLGPVRVLRLENRGLRDLWPLRYLGSHLEELTITDCAAMLSWEFSNLRCLVGLRVLRLGKCGLEEAVLRDLTANMPHLQSLLLNGRELLATDG